MNDVQTTRFTMLCWCLLLFCVIWNGCSSPTFYPVRYDITATTSKCDSVIKLYIDDVTATGAIDDGAILLQLPDGSLRRDKSKQWRDIPTDLLRQAVLSACVSGKWDGKVILVSSSAQADIVITVQLRDFWVGVDDDENPTGATAAAVVQFAPASGKPSTEPFRKVVNNPGNNSIENLYSAMMGQALTNLVDTILKSSCKKGAGSDPPIASLKVATFSAWDSLLNRDVGVVITLDTNKAGTISIRDRFGAPIVEWEIKEWRFDTTVATFNIEYPWSITGAMIEMVEEVSIKKNSSKKDSQKEDHKKGRLLLRFKKIPGIHQLELREQTREAIVEELKGL